MSKEERNITWQSSSINRQDREKHNGHHSRAIWFTGLSGAGKSSLAFALEQYLYDQGVRCYVLDGDNVRHGLNRDLGFTAGDRQENLRRIGEVSKLMVDAGLFVLSAFISPHEQDREMVRQLFEPDDFIEIYVRCSIQECERRDPKGLYKKHAMVTSRISQAFPPPMMYPNLLHLSSIQSNGPLRKPCKRSYSIWSRSVLFNCRFLRKQPSFINSCSLY